MRDIDLAVRRVGEERIAGAIGGLGRFRQQMNAIRFGQRLVGFPEQPGLQLAVQDGRPVALVEATADGLTVVRGFNI